MSDSKHSEKNTQQVRDLKKVKLNFSFSSNLGQLKTRERLRDESEEEEYNAEENEETDNENDKTPSEKNPKN